MEKIIVYSNNKIDKLETNINQFVEHKFFGIIFNKTINISSEKIKTRILEIIKLLDSTNINSIELKKMIFDGLPDDIPSLRSLTWKIILNYLPLNINEWENFIDFKRNQYADYKNKYVTKLELEKLKHEKNKKLIENKNSFIEILDSGINNYY